jgi:hypothetical protein
LRAADGDLAALRDKQYKDASEKEIEELYDQFVSADSRIRFPTVPETQYPNGKSFTLPYLATLPTGSTAVFDENTLYFRQ